MTILYNYFNPKPIPFYRNTENEEEKNHPCLTFKHSDKAKNLN